ncbi:hypothetical protein [Gorillibacterium sp. sgz5001074]|uniref:hypothetical protein n=1 Tax=Gorillibacterium sp. sgz5001074 TaxID=3446695 RepID=UPI003F667FC6
MTYEEFVTEYLELLRELPDDSEESIMVTGFLNEQMAVNDFKVPLEELMVVLKAVRPAIAGYLDLIGSRDFKKLLRSEMPLEEALARLGKPKDYFDLPPQSDGVERTL